MEIDVSTCEYYKSNGKCKIPHFMGKVKFTSCNCNEWDCMFKRYHRREAEYERELKQLLKQAHCYSCGTCNGKEDYVNMQRHCENAIRALHKEQAKVDMYEQKLKHYRGKYV